MNSSRLLSSTSAALALAAAFAALSPRSAIADQKANATAGASDPRGAAQAGSGATSWDDALRDRRGWWSMQPVKDPPLLPLRDTTWSVQPIDRYILSALEAHNLAPAPAAAPELLLRRLCLVLTGLPPTPQQAESFARDGNSTQFASPERARSAAVESLVDALLASPHFGERWARHWMDVVRFTETHGNEWNYEVHHAWRYRDYLVRAFNDDVPYDQLVREHIAGDLLDAPRWNRRERFNESVIGTAFYRFGEVNHDDCISLRQIGYDLADNQIDTLSKAFQATTIACARCHDHKLDAVSMRDYYALLGVIRSTRQVSHTLDAPEVNAPAIQRLIGIKREIREELAQAWQRDAAQTADYLQAALAAFAKRADAADLAKGLDDERLRKWTAVVERKEPPLEDAFAPLHVLAATAASDDSAVAAAWAKLARQYDEESRARTLAAGNFEVYADFRDGGHARWHVDGQGLRETAGNCGQIVISPEGDPVVRAVLPGGCFTHLVSDKLNGALRSPVLPPGKKYISLHVMGQRSSAVRLVSNNCQLNYKNYRALTSGDLGWVTFELPPDREGLRVYTELMTMFDNPKFPDQLSALGGDKENYRVAWEQAAANPRSYFGVTRVVLHDGPDPPRPELSHLHPLFAGAEAANLADGVARYAAVISTSIGNWAADRSGDDEVRWIDALLRAGLLGNRRDMTERMTTLLDEYRRVETELALPRIAPGVGDFGPGFDQPLLVRGDCLRQGEKVPRRYLEALARSGEPFAGAGSGRLELADRIASRDNPLTARVMANRIWHHLFGAGLVRTVDDFGHVGDLPSHPELLDYLATRFVEDGWSIKRLIRSIVLTRTFQLSNRPSLPALKADPPNRLLQHYPARRMEAEGIRDCILATSGRLDRSLYGMSIQPYREQANADRRLFPGPLDGNGRRSIYIKNNLMEAPKFLAAFNLPGGKVTQGRRDVTNVPAQALALLNDPFVLEQAGVWAARLVERGDESVAARVDAMFQLAFSRCATADDTARLQQAVAQLAELHQVAASDVPRNQAIWSDVAHAIFNMQEFIYIP